MTFSIAITTYNRPLHLANLVNQVMACTLSPHEIVVVDSSDQPDDTICMNKQVRYVRSSHKNQPYQRYLAYLCCKTDVIIFLDDDLEIIDSRVFAVMLNRLKQSEIRGVSVGFRHHHSISDLMDSQVDNSSLLFRVVNLLSGVPVLKPGKIYLAGLAGPRPESEGLVDYFNGAIMGFYKSELDSLFNPDLFSLFEQKLGMGEDKVISMTVGLHKKIWFIPQIFFVHPPLASNYFMDIQSFQRKVTYSRLYISLVYGRHRGYPSWMVRLHYYYFIGWRILISGFRAILKPTKKRIAITKGVFQGVLLTFTLPFDSRKIAPQIDWQRDATYDSGHRI